MPDLESFLAETRVVFFQFNRFPMPLNLIWYLPWRISDEVHQGAKFRLLDAVGSLELKAEWRLTKELHRHLVFGWEVLGQLATALAFFEIINE